MSVVFIKRTKGKPFTIRLSPKTRFALELLSRKLRRTQTDIIEIALEKEILQELTELNNRKQIKRNLLNEIWDPEEPDRFVKMALNLPDLLSEEELLRWKIIKEKRQLWIAENKPNYSLIRDEWEIILEETNKRYNKV